jgi:hypothetical protein
MGEPPSDAGGDQKNRMDPEEGQGRSSIKGIEGADISIVWAQSFIDDRTLRAQIVEWGYKLSRQ